jgi:hypothetical protein
MHHVKNNVIADHCNLAEQPFGVTPILTFISAPRIETLGIASLRCPIWVRIPGYHRQAWNGKNHSPVSAFATTWGYHQDCFPLQARKDVYIVKGVKMRTTVIGSG